ncbi:MAG: DNA-processing protein DprA [Ardenticatenaceae bacterium]|nr:DNA-processing protein DprA [Ardenticatenaceae bacterium]
MNDRSQSISSSEVEVELPTFRKSWQLYLDRRVAEDAAPYILDAPAMLGDPAIWTRITQGEPTLALLSSTKAPAGVLLAVHDLARQWRHRGPIIISGFHAPVENEALSVLLRGSHPLVLVLARRLYRRPPDGLRPALNDGRLLILSPFKESLQRVSAATAAARNRLVAALADEVLIAHAEPGSKTEALAHAALSWGKPVYTLDHPANAGLLAQGIGVYASPA